jgi:signal-transduction protein with cAMP-binding, CBS, and nucleotidyltransferase domain
MQQIRHAMQQMIAISEQELDEFLSLATIKIVKRNEFLNRAGSVANEIFFINKGILRVIVEDREGTEHTVHFALENQFVTDYSSFILKQPSINILQAMEETEVVVLPRKSIEWGYANLKEGEKMGRLIAEYYFIYQDNRIKNTYCRTPKERYDSITDVFPNLHNRVPQHTIASYLGISPIHLSRLKKADYTKT